MAITNNKQIPTQVLDQLQLYYTKESLLFKRVKSDGEFLVKYIDSDITSNFFFEITTYGVDINNSISFLINRAPQSGYSVAAGKSNIHSSVLQQHFDVWFEELKKFSVIRGPMEEEDAILKQYEEDFFSSYQLIDADANTKSYSYNIQLKIDTFLEELNLKLEQSKDENNTAEIEEIQHDALELRSRQTRLTKTTVFHSLGKIVSKCRKVGFDIGKWVLETFLKALAEATVKAIAQGGE